MFYYLLVTNKNGSMIVKQSEDLITRKDIMSYVKSDLLNFLSVPAMREVINGNNIERNIGENTIIKDFHHDFKLVVNDTVNPTCYSIVKQNTIKSIGYFYTTEHQTKEILSQYELKQFNGDIKPEDVSRCHEIEAEKFKLEKSGLYDRLMDEIKNRKKD